ncbi:electron transfer flavoprotein-ubiquinone oxidoreductase [Larsenimonas rhizosphaerae]|uniref:Electron transfer flavoprotein-ubiquinone oxidoreductase n=1 Tax=Larsenimonas rhizosphaerae TaxID=2944682 RepID=A0AA42CU28_9GAMM|nr:electron transfer flavoprotein-ubiquinone oxidoreductase [Larsenimonas rhizosphaerae]MCX2523656.1 electron transfer flavoprotein-ubiquinone oxidoreductase [Larsenimonas rhizosphaerae]
MLDAEREYMEFDVVIIGAGAAGLSAACRLMQQASEAGTELSVCVLEKGAETGAHILSGAVFEPRALDELFPDWEARQAPLTIPVSSDDIFLLKDEQDATRLPHIAVPRTMLNDGNYVISAGNLCRWLAEQAESLGVDIFPGFAAQELLLGENGEVQGVLTGDMGVNQAGEPRETYMPGMGIRGKYTLFAEGARGHLGKQVISRYALDAGKDPQHYALGIKELWDIPAEHHQPGRVIHTTGWPTEGHAHGGGFLYHGDNQQVMVGFFVDLDYENPWVSPFDEMQRLKHHPVISKHLRGGTRVAYGARAVTKGGYNCLPDMAFPGGLLIGCDAGTLNFAKIKGLHTAMKSGMLAAESVFDALSKGDSGGRLLEGYKTRVEQSWLHEELYTARNFGPAIHRLGTVLGGAFNTLDQALNGRLPTLHDRTPDYARLQRQVRCEPIDYPKPDGILSFDRTSSVYLSNTNHDEDQPCHLKLTDPSIPIQVNMPEYAEPAVRYCPAGVYEVVEDSEDAPRFQINFQNCVHCKTCDIKDPAQNITWVAPEGGGGPNYPNM